MLDRFLNQPPQIVPRYEIVSAERIVMSIRPILHNLITERDINVIGIVLDNAPNVTLAAENLSAGFGLFAMSSVAHQILVKVVVVQD